ncbi:MAG: DegV family protein [Anaerolineales bacterium]
MLRIVTDGAADMPAAWREEFQIDVIPINIHFGEKTYLQAVDLDNDGFYRLVDESHKIPKTSQPSPFQFSEFYQKVARPGDTILSIHVTSKLSGTFNSAVTAARELAGKLNIIPFDSMNGSAGIAFLCREARRLDSLGKNVGEIVEALNNLRQRVRVMLVLDSLEYARLNGRVGAIQAAMASLLRVKPIVVLKDGALEIVEKVRTRQASFDRLLEMVKEAVGDGLVDMAIVHARDLQSGQQMMARAKEIFNIRELFLADLSISVAANLGPGTVGIVFQPLE